MIIQENGILSRKNNDKYSKDIEYLKKYYAEHNEFPLFNQVLIETRTDCNNHCIFCPQTHFQKPLGIMSIDCFCEIINQLIKVQYAGRIAFLLSNEPLLDNRLIDMIKIARTASPRFFLDLTTNGKLLTLAMLDKLFAYGLDNITINDYRADRDFDKNIISDNLLEIMDKYKNNPKVTYRPRRTDEILSNYAGIIHQIETNNKYGFCNYPFRKIAIAYNGEILLCCNDFSYKTTMGNIFKDSIIDVWHSEVFNQHRVALLNNERIGLCTKCNEIQNYNIY
jgi:radical SAM protein with 4Fe4S-binding SPASM domain